MEVPSELARLDQWVCWRLTKRRGAAKATKVPHSGLDGRLASVTDPTRWTSLQDALAGQERWHMDGIGFVFTADDPYCGVDLDSCIDEAGEVHPKAQEMLDWIDSYTEVSPSGTGVHCIVKAQIHGGHRLEETEWGGNFEAYDQERYFTFTGKVLGSSDIRESAIWIDVQEKTRKADGSWMEKARRSSDFCTLYDDGDFSGYDSQSNADLALMNMLVHYIGELRPRSVLIAFQNSALYRGESKSGGTDYIWRTLERALDDGGGNRTETRFEREVGKQMFLIESRDEARFRIAQKHAKLREFPYPVKEWSLQDELALPPREHVWRVQDLQRVHGNVVLIAGYKLGKTTLIMNLIRSLVDGTPFLGLFEVDQVEGNVAVFNYELDPEQWVDWARDMHFENPEKVKPFHLRGLGALQFWLPNIQDRLVEWMLENEVCYWVLDPTAQAWDTLLESEGDNIRAAQFTRAIDTVKARAHVDEANLTHHTSRANQEAGRGPSALEGWYDAGWFLTGKRDELQFHAIGRDVDISPTNVAFHEDQHRSFFLDTRAEKEEVAEKKEAKRVALEILRELGPQSQSAMGKELKARGVGVSTNRLKKMLEGWCGSADNPMAFKEELLQGRRTRTYYLKESG